MLLKSLDSSSLLEDVNHDPMQVQVQEFDADDRNNAHYRTQTQPGRLGTQGPPKPRALDNRLRGKEKGKFFPNRFNGKKISYRHTVEGDKNCGCDQRCEHSLELALLAIRELY
jgi:hypothetical protein